MSQAETFDNTVARFTAVLEASLNASMVTTFPLTGSVTVVDDVASVFGRPHLDERENAVLRSGNATRQWFVPRDVIAPFVMTLCAIAVPVTCSSRVTAY